MRRIGLYSLIALVSLALVGVLAAGVGVALNSEEDAKVTQADTPTVAEPEAPATAPEKTKEETKKEETKKEETKKEETTSEDQQAAQEQAAAEQAAQEQAAAEQAAQEQAAAEQAAQEQAAAEQAAQEQRWRELAEQRDAEARAAEQAAAEEQAAARQAAPAVPTSTALNLTVPSAGIQNAPVSNSIAESALANGAGKIPSTGFPWQSGANTYIAGHVYGYPNTGSWQLFASVPSMAQGDAIFLTDANGTTYEYRVNQILRVAPTDVWVAQPTGQKVVSLQTCVGPGWSERLIVRGTLVGTSQA